MTTKTDPAAELTKLEAAVTEAHQNTEATRERLRVQQAGRQQLEVNLARLAHTEPDEFDANGQPRGDSAKKLAAALAEATASRLPDVLAGDEQREKAARTELGSYLERNAEDLSRGELEGPGHAAALKMRNLAAALVEAHREYVASASRQMRICSAVRGLDGRDVRSDDRAAEIARLAAGLHDLAPPRSESLTPRAGMDGAPRRQRIKSGGFVKSPLAVDLEGVQQPEPVQL